MAILSYPYTSLEGDRKYTAAELARAAATLTTSGIVPVTNSFLCAIVPGSMNISIEPGEARIEGHEIVSDEQEIVTLSLGNATNPRIDLVVLESNESTGVRAARIIVLEGTPSSDPVVPTLTQETGLWQEALCSIRVPAGATTLNTATLTDLRSFCIGKHRHAITDVPGLEAALNAKANASHGHSISNVSGLQTALDGKAASSHNHAISNVSGLQSALDGKAASSHNHTLTSLSGYSSFRDYIDDRDRALQTQITHIVTDTLPDIGDALAKKAAVSHTHDSRYYTESQVDSKLDAKQDALEYIQRRRITVSGNSPSGGDNGDLWVKV
jgi:hypothetical protein